MTRAPFARAKDGTHGEPRMRCLRRLPGLVRLGFLVLIGLGILSGCDVFDFAADVVRIGDEAAAQNERRIETFTISASTFLILTDTEPTVTVQDGATVYTQLDGSISFTPTGSTETQTFTLDPEDTVIERPAQGLVTIVRME